MERPRVVALLESMWGETERRAPRWFRINPYNFSGRRLYQLVGKDVNLLVTNCCPVMQVSANHHGRPDPAYVKENLERIAPTLLLVCGHVAARTYKNSAYVARCTVIHMKHPAARTWTKQEVESMKERIAKCIVT